MIGKRYWVIVDKHDKSQMMALYRSCGSKTRHPEAISDVYIPRMFHTYKQANNARVMRKRGFFRLGTRKWIQDHFNIDNTIVVPFRWIEDEHNYSNYIIRKKNTELVMPQSFVGHTSKEPKADIPRLVYTADSCKRIIAIWKSSYIHSLCDRQAIQLEPVRVRMGFL